VSRFFPSSPWTKAAFWIWSILVFVAGTSLTAAHMYALPKPADGDPALVRAMSSLRASADRGAWMAVHALYARCRCSRRILQHLVFSHRPEGVREKILLVGSLPELEPILDRISARGFEIVETDPTELRDRFHVEGVPLLLVFAPDGTLRHTGGYTERKQGPNPRDAEILEGLMAERAVPELPVFGCAVSDELRALLDPLGIRTARGP
jgi:hypothetical protein